MPNNLPLFDGPEILTPETALQDPPVLYELFDWRNMRVWPTPMCLHSCDTPACVNPNHLRAGTQTENMQEMASKGRHPRLLFGALSGSDAPKTRPLKSP